MATNPRETEVLPPLDSDDNVAAFPGYTPVQLAPRGDGWTADRQRVFLAALAESGSVTRACLEAGITARSAYRLRAHAKGAAFAEGWDQALRVATRRLVTLAFERATNGGLREQWRDGRLVSETRQPSDKLLIFLLQSLAPHNAADDTRWARLDRMAGEAGAAFATTLDALRDEAQVPADELHETEFMPVPPDHADGAPRRPFDEDENGDPSRARVHTRICAPAHARVGV